MKLKLFFTSTLGVMNDLILNMNVGREQASVNYDERDTDGGQGNRIQNIKLPSIALPTFSGDFSQWTSFHDLFDSLVVK